MKRRTFLAAGTASLIAGGSRAETQIPIKDEKILAKPFTPIEVSRERLIGSVVGLRPYRPRGFRIEAEAFGDKTLIHNYGHGGGGVSLSWGCAEQAVALAKETRAPNIAVIGAGVIGLTTARELQAQGAQVTLYAEQFSPEITSDAAGALWWPSLVYRKSGGSPEFRRAYRKAWRRSFSRFKALADDPRYGVDWVRQLFLRRPTLDAAIEDWREESPIAEADFYPGYQTANDIEGPFGFRYVTAYYTFVIDPGVFMAALTEDFLAAGGTITTARFESDKDVAGLKEDAVVNCTGLGAKELFGDRTLIPVRGQLSLLEPQAKVDYSYITRTRWGHLYMFPRRTGIVLGGSMRFGSTSLDIDAREERRMLVGHGEIMGGAS